GAACALATSVHWTLSPTALESGCNRLRAKYLRRQPSFAPFDCTLLPTCSSPCIFNLAFSLQIASDQAVASGRSVFPGGGTEASWHFWQLRRPAGSGVRSQGSGVRSQEQESGVRGQGQESGVREQ